ncbi:MAG: cupin-like domain-containing protein [Gammaproteobacteria bacterium]|nr:cupin-like domain-containing protein [Gammaproteobacteria bacterium]NNC97587.1 cupin-like domain-containing protein [Gammaproteobacteria bacterium]NNM14796.1 cupin-like domain-containing protein [Gammaproteobacteria bacterium]
MTSISKDIFAEINPVPEVILGEDESLDAYFAQRKPFVVRGLVNDWPLVQAGLSSGKAARQYLLNRHQDRPFVISIGPEDAEGRIFYNNDMSMNIQMGRAKLPEIFERMDRIENDEKLPIMYLASIDMQAYFKDLAEANTVDLGARDLIESIWIGTRTRIAAHNDFPDNLACVAVGHRRFTLFPPEQFRNLYLGPVDNTPAGRAVSMVDFHNPDFVKHSKFREAVKHAQVANLSPGDAVFIPSLWWHHVEGLDAFNVLVNYWWRETPKHLGQPQNALNHAMMAIRDLPDDEKKIWRDLFDYYVFNNTDDVVNHIPEFGRGILDTMTAENSSKIRTYLLRALNQ